MKTIYFFSIPLFGHVNYGLKLAKKIQTMGYEVVYYSGSSYKDFIESKGVNFHNYSYKIEELFSEKNSTYNNSFMGSVEPEKLDHISEWYNFCSHLYKIRKIFMENDIHKMRKPDLIVYDSAALWGNSIASYFNVRSVASCTPYYYPEKYANSNYSEFVRLILQKTYEEKKAERVVHILEKSLKGSILEPLSPIADCRLIYSVDEFQSGREYVDNETYFIGPLIEKEEYDNVDINLISSSIPNIYIAFGSIYNNAKVFRKIYEACKDLNLNFILNIGKNNKVSDFSDLPYNWHVVQRINQLAVLRKTQLFVSHGGVNSVREAMYFGVPIIAVPSEGDTLCSAKDIVECNVGKNIHVSQIDTIKDLIMEVLHDSEIADKCRNISTKMSNAGGIEKATKIIISEMEK